MAITESLPSGLVLHVLVDGSQMRTITDTDMDTDAETSAQIKITNMERVFRSVCMVSEELMVSQEAVTLRV